MSTIEGVRLIESAKAHGQRVTAETCPQYLLLTKDSKVPKASYAKVDPPLRSADDTRALWEGLRHGTVDIVTSDHAPHTRAEKDTDDIFRATSGMPGVETMLPLMLTKVNEGIISLGHLSRVMSESVAKLFGLYPRKGTLQVGSDADFTVVDLSMEKTIRKETLYTKGREFVVFDGWKIKGVPTGTVVRGQIVMWDGQIVGKPGIGKFIKPVALASRDQT